MTTTSLPIANAPAEWVLIIEPQGGFPRHKSIARNRGQNLSGGPIQPLIMPGEHRANEAFLHPGFSFSELVVRSQTGKLRACAGSAGGTVVSFSRAQHKVP